jgi:hypothetical protein
VYRDCGDLVRLERFLIVGVLLDEIDSLSPSLLLGVLDGVAAEDCLSMLGKSRAYQLIDDAFVKREGWGVWSRGLGAVVEVRRNHPDSLTDKSIDPVFAVP